MINLIYCAYLLTALFASVSACCANSPGNINLHAHWIALASNVDFLLYLTIFPASVAILSNASQQLKIYLLRVCDELFLGYEVCLEEENLTITYDRQTDYPTWQDWDGDCQNNRHEVLINEHIDDDQNHPLVLSSDNCYVNSGKWYDPYDNIYFYNSSEVQIDHVVALYEAHKSGAWYFPAARKLKFANNIDFDDLLIAVGGSSNSKKSSFDPASWMPSNIDYSCEYLRKWLNIKAEFRLSIDEDEKIAIESLYNTNNC